MKESQFHPREVLRISIEVEEAGARLYEKLQAKTNDGRVKRIWGYLKEQEEEHKRIFSRILDESGSDDVYEFQPGNYQNYIKAISSEYIFTPKLIEEKEAQLFENDLEAVEFGINIEKDSILLYSSLKEYMKLERRELIGKIIEQEEEHYTDLVNLKESLVRSS